LTVKPRLHQGNMLPGNMLPGRATCIRIHICCPATCCRQHVARVARSGNIMLFMSRSTCIPLYPATDGQQTGNNFFADTRNMLTATCYRGVNAAFMTPQITCYACHYSLKQVTVPTRGFNSLF